MFYVYKPKYGIGLSFIGSFSSEELAKAKAQGVKGIVRRDSYEGQIIYDYRG